MSTFSVENTGFLLIDVQEKLFAAIQHPRETLDKIHILIQACQLLHVPIIVSEQYPKGLGSTVESILARLHPDTPIVTKTAFSCLKEPALHNTLVQQDKKFWIIAGIESHICVQQTAEDLQAMQLPGCVAIDACSSRHAPDHSIAITTMQQQNIRCSTVETIIFALMQDAKHPQFKEISQMFRSK